MKKLHLILASSNGENNLFTGSIPPEIGSLELLQELYVIYLNIMNRG